MLDNSKVEFICNQYSVDLIKRIVEKYCFQL
jgi:hypothetical protein